MVLSPWIIPQCRHVSQLFQFFYAEHQGTCQVLLETFLRQKWGNFWLHFIGQVEFDPLVMGVWWGSVFLRFCYFLQCQLCIPWIRQRLNFHSLINRGKGNFKSYTMIGGSALAFCTISCWQHPPFPSPTLDLPQRLSPLSVVISLSGCIPLRA